MDSLKLGKKLMVFAYLFDNGPAFTGFRNNDLSKIDVINLSFGIIYEGKVSVKSVPNIREIISSAHDVRTKVVLAIGGWGVNGFSDAVYDDKSRKIFIDSIIDKIKIYKLDGIDIDWEYPSSSAGGNKGRSEDIKNLNIFMKELRERLNEVNEDLILSIAVASGEWAANKYYDLETLNNYVDYVHLMSYDLINYPTDNNPNVKITHHTNLYPSKYSVSSADAGVNALIRHGISKDKINLGIAFYGHVYETNEETKIGLNCISDRNKKRTISYKKIKDNILSDANYTVFYDETAHSNWIFGNKTVFSYDSEISIESKCEYAKDLGLNGVMIWEYCKDDDSSSLLDCINNNVY